MTALWLTCTQLQGGVQGSNEHVTSRLSKRHDLVTACYVLSEIEDASQRRRVVESLWQTTGDTLLIAEPGTPIGSAIVREARWQVCCNSYPTCHAVCMCCASSDVFFDPGKCGENLVAFLSLVLAQHLQVESDQLQGTTCRQQA